jgi:hypothetical protein
MRLRGRSSRLAWCGTLRLVSVLSGHSPVGGGRVCEQMATSPGGVFGYFPGWTQVKGVLQLMSGMRKRELTARLDTLIGVMYDGRWLAQKVALLLWLRRGTKGDCSRTTTWSAAQSPTEEFPNMLQYIRNFHLKLGEGKPLPSRACALCSCACCSCSHDGRSLGHQQAICRHSDAPRLGTAPGGHRTAWRACTHLQGWTGLPYASSKRGNACLVNRRCVRPSRLVVESSTHAMRYRP